jgi:hypothetical protein
MFHIDDQPSGVREFETNLPCTHVLLSTNDAPFPHTIPQNPYCLQSKKVVADYQHAFATWMTKQGAAI